MELVRMRQLEAITFWELLLGKNFWEFVGIESVSLQSKSLTWRYGKWSFLPFVTFGRHVSWVRWKVCWSISEVLQLNCHKPGFQTDQKDKLKPQVSQTATEVWFAVFRQSNLELGLGQLTLWWPLRPSALTTFAINRVTFKWKQNWCSKNIQRGRNIKLSGAAFGRHKSCQQGKRQVPAATTFCEQVQNVTLVHAVSAGGLILDQCSF